jgi:hypothetical protein
MILFLSTSFLRRLRIQWKPSLKGFLIGDRNLFFFYPDLFLEVPEITPATINSFLEQHGKESWQLLGFLSPEELPALPGYSELNTGDRYDPIHWKARIHLIGEQGIEQRKLEVRLSGEL